MEKRSKEYLNRIRKTASLTAIGDIRCISGYGIKIHDVDSGLDGNFGLKMIHTLLKMESIQ